LHLNGSAIDERVRRRGEKKTGEADNRIRAKRRKLGDR